MDKPPPLYDVYLHLRRLFAFLRRAFLWSRIKPLGELTLLTRASYIFLLFVPLLAGIWPVATKFVFKDAFLPLTWVLTFFAALSAVIAQTLYQMFAPDVVRRNSRQDYMSSEAKRYFENPLPGELEWAESTLRELGDHRDIMVGEVQTTTGAMSFLGKEDIQSYHAETVAKASGIIYDRQDRRFLFPAVVSAFCYLVCLSLVGYIISTQVISVLEAAGLLTT